MYQHKQLACVFLMRNYGSYSYTKITMLKYIHYEIANREIIKSCIFHSTKKMMQYGITK